MKLILLLLASSLVLLHSGCASLARRAILPGSYLKAPQNIVVENPRYELLTLHTSRGTKFVAQFGAALDEDGRPLADSHTRPTVLFFYGNRMCLAGSQQIFEDFRRMGANVLIPEYPGYGMSEGIASEQACYAVADAALRHVQTRQEIDPSRIVVAGLSIGCGPAVDLSSRNSIAAVVLVVPLTSIRQIGRDVAPWYIRWAVPLLARHAAFDNLAKLPKVTAPILIIRATRDAVTSSKRSTELSAAARAPLETIEVDSDHDGAWQAGKEHIALWLSARFPGNPGASTATHRVINRHTPLARKP